MPISGPCHHKSASYEGLASRPLTHSAALCPACSCSPTIAVPAAAMAVSTKADLNPRTTSYEFLGPPGAFFITIAVPATTYALYFGCSEATGGCPPPVAGIWPSVSASLSNPEWWKSLWDTQAAALYLAWYVFCVVAWFVLPGDWVEGTTIRDGSTKKYKINGVHAHYRPSRPG